jgi:hypothetical protein
VVFRAGFWSVGGGRPGGGGWGGGAAEKLEQGDRLETEEKAAHRSIR